MAAETAIGVVVEAAAGVMTTKRRGRKLAKVRGVYEFPKGSGNWCIVFCADGRRHRESVGTRAMAIDLYRQRRTEIKNGRKFPDTMRAANCPTLAGFAQRFIDGIQLQNGNKPRTVSFYAQNLKRLLDYSPLALAKLSAIDEALIEDWARQRAQTVTIATVNHGLTTLRRALRLAQRWRVIDRVPQIRLLPGARQREYVLPREAEATYLRACSPLLREIAVLLLDTGLRVGEAATLLWEDISFADHGYVRVREGKSRYALRAIALTPRVRALLYDRRKGAESNWVFPSASAAGHVLGSSLDHEHRKARRKAGLGADFVIHSLRHTFCTRLGESGADAFTIQRMAGHHSITVSQRYVHPTNEAGRLAIARLAAANEAFSSSQTATKTATRLLEASAEVMQIVDSKAVGR